ncbi:hypothetical protein OY671_012133, partial [Metschnikowia pulcherrima]
ARRQVARLSGADARVRNRRDRQRRRLDRVGRCRRQASCRAAIGWRAAGAGGLWARRHPSDHDRRQSPARPYRPGQLRRRGGGTGSAGGGCRLRAAVRPARAQPRGTGAGGDPHRQRQHDHRAAAGVHQQGLRSARFRADGLRRRRGDARGGAGR